MYQVAPSILDLNSAFEKFLRGQSLILQSCLFILEVSGHSSSPKFPFAHEFSQVCSPPPQVTLQAP